MNKNTILDYVMETPGNTNRAVLSSMLDSIESGGSDRVLLYENDALDISQVYDNWIYGEPRVGLLNLFNVDYPNNYLLIIDDVELSAPLEKDDSSYYVGVKNPADSIHFGTNKIGCQFDAMSPTNESKKVVGMMTMIMLDKNYFTVGTHSVRLYKEI